MTVCDVCWPNMIFQGKFNVRWGRKSNLGIFACVNTIFKFLLTYSITSHNFWSYTYTYYQYHGMTFKDISSYYLYVAYILQTSWLRLLNFGNQMVFYYASLKTQGNSFHIDYYHWKGNFGFCERQKKHDFCNSPIARKHDF